MKFLACTDGSEYGDKAVKLAAQYAERLGFDLTVLHVSEIYYTANEEELAVSPGFRQTKEKVEAILSKTKKMVEEVSKDIKCDERIAWGPVSSEIVRIAEAEGFDGIIMGTKGLTGLKRMLLGSVADDVIRHAHCPVTVVR